jgi:chromosomal replication initiator protein
LSAAPRYSAPDLWQSILDQLSIRVSRQNYENWLRETVGLRFEGTLLVVGAPSELTCDWLATRLRKVVAQVAKAVVGPGLSICYEAPVTRPAAANPTDEPIQPLLLQEPPTPLNPRYTFASLFEGEFNRFAVRSAGDLIERPESACSPLLVLAPAGCGKTHLLHAIGHAAQQRNEHYLLVNAEQFLADFGSANRQRSWPEFRARYRGVDLLLVDDVHTLEGKIATQAEFLQTVVALQDSGRRLVVTADGGRMLGGHSDSQRWALVAEIGQPAIEDRTRFLQDRFAAQRVEVPVEVVHYMALRKASPRDLEAALNQVVAHSRISSEAISIDLAARAMQPFAGQASQPIAQLPPAAIIDAVCARLGVSPDDLRGAKRSRAISHARHVAMYLLRQDGGLTLKSIAQALAKKDHSTVVYGCNTIAGFLESSPTLRADIDSIRAALSERFTAA